MENNNDITSTTDNQTNTQIDVSSTQTEEQNIDNPAQPTETPPEPSNDSSLQSTGEASPNQSNDSSAQPTETSLNQSKDSPAEPSLIWLTSILLGTIGVHDFVMHRWGRGCVHIAMTLAGFLLPQLLPLLFATSQGGFAIIGPETSFALSLFGYLPSISWFWGLFEAMKYQLDYEKPRKVNNIQKLSIASLKPVKVIITIFSVTSLILVIAALATMVLANQCSGSECAGYGWMMAMIIWATIPTFIVLIISCIYYYIKKAQIKKNGQLDSASQNQA